MIGEYLDVDGTSPATFAHSRRSARMLHSLGIWPFSFAGKRGKRVPWTTDTVPRGQQSDHKRSDWPNRERTGPGDAYAYTVSDGVRLGGLTGSGIASGFMGHP